MVTLRPPGGASSGGSQHDRPEEPPSQAAAHANTAQGGGCLRSVHHTSPAREGSLGLQLNCGSGCRKKVRRWLRWARGWLWRRCRTQLGHAPSTTVAEAPAAGAAPFSKQKVDNQPPNCKRPAVRGANNATQRENSHYLLIRGAAETALTRRGLRAPKFLRRGAHLAAVFN